MVPDMACPLQFAMNAADMPRALYGYMTKGDRVVLDPSTWSVVLGVLSAPPGPGGARAVVKRMTGFTDAAASSIVQRVRAHAKLYREGRPARGAAPDPRLSAALALAGDPPEEPPPLPRAAQRKGTANRTVATRSPRRGDGQGRRIA